MGGVALWLLSRHLHTNWFAELAYLENKWLAIYTYLHVCLKGCWREVLCCKKHFKNKTQKTDIRRDEWVKFLKKSSIVCDSFQLMSNKLSLPCHSEKLVLWPYLIETPSSHTITKVKQHKPCLIPRWVTSWEYQVLLSWMCKWHNR